MKKTTSNKQFKFSKYLLLMGVIILCFAVVVPATTNLIFAVDNAAENTTENAETNATPAEETTLASSGYTLENLNSNTGDTKATVLTNSDKILSKDYLDFVGIPTSYFTYSNNGGQSGSQSLDKAFDRDFSTYWKGSDDYYNNGKHTVDEVEVADFHNTVTAEFKDAIKIDRIIYNTTAEGSDKGYPNTLRIHIYKDGTEIKTYNYSTKPTTSKMLFEFGGAVECDAVVLEWVLVNKNHWWNAAASEIIFLQEDMEIPELFSDFCKLTLREEYDTQEELNELKEQLKSNVNYEGTIKEDLDRAEKIISGELKWEKQRQMSVNPTKGEATLRQEGDMQSYMRNTLDFGWYGTNKQVIGISGQKGEQLKIYVDGKEGDPLPKVVCTQFYGHWSGWQTGEIQLSLGENTITIPTWDESKLTYPYQHISGGPIYITNPYKSSRQSDEVKVYVEGGQTYPIFRKGDDVDDYLSELSAYVNKRNSDEDYKSKTYDLTELESDYTQMTIKASLANTKYSTENNTIDPQKNLENWDKYMRDLLAFDGVEFDKDGRHYAEENEHLRLNFRLAQPVGAAFGANSQVGIFTDDWIGGTITHGGNLGWGFAHEIGHTMDTWQLIVSESTNNMISKYDETVRGAASRGNFSTDIETLSNDRAYAKTKADNPDYTYFDTNRLNFLVWWHVESLHPGTWGKVKNYLRYPDDNEHGLKLSETTKGMSNNEKNIYYFCLASGVDLGEYFERFGYRLNTSEGLFYVDKASDAYKEAIEDAKDKGIIEDKECTRYWYLDATEYNYVVAGKDTDVYKKSDKPTIKSVKSVSGGYSILMLKQSIAAQVDKEKAQLGYEILEGNETDGYEIIGFTTGRSYTDKSEYEEGYTPTYKVRAVDRGLNYSGYSEEKQPTKQVGVCRIGETYYDSLAEAVSAAEAGATIVLVKSTDISPITVNKNLTITAESNVSITRAESGDLITVTAGTLTVKGEGNLTIDGDDFKQYGSLIYLNGGSLNISSTTLKNNDTTTNGGAIRASNGHLYMDSCTVTNNSANSGGGICIDSKCTADYITNSKIENNTATYNGGGIFSSGGGIIGSTSGTSKPSTEGTSISNNKAANGGGLWLDGRSTINKATVNNNTATNYGGGFWIKGSNTARIDDIVATSVEGNIAGKGGNAVYIEGSATQVALNTVSLVGTEEKEASVYVASGKSVNFTETDVPALEFPNSKTITIKQESDGILIKQNNSSVDVGEAGGTAVLPVISLGSKTIDNSTLTTILNDTSGELKSYSIGDGGHVGRQTAAVKAGCTTDGNSEYYTCITHQDKEEYFSDAACTNAIEKDSWIIKAKGHSMLKHDAKKATCEGAGCEEYYYCSECHNYYADENGETTVEPFSWLVGKTGHNWRQVSSASGRLVSSHERCSHCGATRKYTNRCTVSYVKSFKVSKGKAKVTAKWKKQSKKVQKKFSGYQVRYSRNSGMNGAVYRNVGRSKSSVKIKKLARKKRYYVQIRSYVRFGGVTYYSNWSAVKSTVTK